MNFTALADALRSRGALQPTAAPAPAAPVAAGPLAAATPSPMANLGYLGGNGDTFGLPMDQTGGGNYRDAFSGIPGIQTAFRDPSSDGNHYNVIRFTGKGDDNEVQSEQGQLIVDPRTGAVTDGGSWSPYKRVSDGKMLADWAKTAAIAGGGLNAMGFLGGAGAAGAAGATAAGEGLAGAAPAYTTAAADSALVGGAPFAGSVPAAVDLGGAGGLGVVSTGGGVGSTLSGGLSSLNNWAKANPFLANMAGKGVSALVPALLGGHGGGGGSAADPTHNLDALPAATSRAFSAFSPSENNLTPAARPGHTRGPSGAVNLADPSAAAFGYGPQHLYYEEPHAGGGAVGESTDWLDNLSGLLDSFGMPVGGGDTAPAAAAPEDTSQSVLDLFRNATPTTSDPNAGAAPPEVPRLSRPVEPQITDSSSWLERLLSGDPRTGRQALGALGLLGSLTGSRTPRGYTSAAEMQAQLKSPYSNWTPQQQTNFNRYFYAPPKVYVPPPQSPTGRKFAAGGDTGVGGGPLSPSFYVAGPDGGQSDTVHAKLSHGEYVLDADVVSALGDGNNAAGAKRLDGMREAIRAHKRSAPADRVPPRAHHPLDYLKG